VRAIALLAGALCLVGCAPEGPRAEAPLTPCQHTAALASNPYASPGAVELGLEFTRVKCFGATPDGSRQMPGATVSSPKPLVITPQDDDASMFRKDMHVQDRNAAQKYVWRAEIVLLTAEGVGTNAIMRRTGKSKTCVWRWQERFIEEGFDGLLRDKPRPSRIKPLGVEAAERVVALTLAEPPGETTHWTGALMSKAAGLSVSSIQRIWRAYGLQPHRTRQFKLSNDPRFVDKLRDVVGLYVDPPAHAIVPSVDEKSQIQALDRTQPRLPLKKGRAGTMTHDYVRHGTTTLFAAMNVLDGSVIGRNMQRYRHQEFIRSSMSSRSRFRRARRSTPSSTTTPPTSIPMFGDGSNVICDGRFISRRHPRPGSTPSRASSRP
jgi:transposase